MFARNKQYPYIVTTILMVMFLFGALFTVAMGMNMDMNGNMTPCPFMPDNAAVCPMTFATHITQWQQFFTALPSGLLVVLLILVSVVLFTLSLFRKQSLLQPRIRHFLKRHRHDLKVFAPLHLAFSSGILNSRLFA